MDLVNKDTIDARLPQEETQKRTLKDYLTMGGLIAAILVTLAGTSYLILKEVDFSKLRPEVIPYALSILAIGALIIGGLLFAACAFPEYLRSDDFRE